MKVVIAGSGEVGFHIAEQLVLENRDVVVVEKDPERVKHASAHLDCLVVNGDATDLDLMKELGMGKADAFVSATDSDEVNLISCLLVSGEFDVPVTVARVRNLSYSKSRVIGGSYSGINFLVNPDIEAANAISNTVQYGAMSGMFIFEDSDVQLRDIYVDEDSFYRDKSLVSIKGKIKEDFIIAGILREDEIIIPSGDSIVQEGDHIYAVASADTFTKIFNKVGNPRRRLKNILIVGGGMVGSHVAEFLLGQGKNIKIVEKKYSVCKRIADKFPNALIIHGDISDQSLYEDESLEKSDLIICTTQNEELNILTAVYAKSQGIKKAVTLVNKMSYLHISDELGIDATVSPKISSVNAILKFIRRGNIKNVYKIFDGRAEVIEITLPPSSKVVGKRIMDLKLPKESLIVAITRENKIHIPSGEFVLQDDDTVITFSKHKFADDIEQLFSG